jgi:tRNA(His) 5'-end guanylyltransferase
LCLPKCHVILKLELKSNNNNFKFNDNFKRPKSQKFIVLPINIPLLMQTRQDLCLLYDHRKGITFYSFGLL